VPCHHNSPFRPSLTDLFFVLLIFWLFLADPRGWSTLLRDGDTGMHLRTGDYILTQGSIPKADIFSYTKPGERWFAMEWLWCAAFAWLNRAAGLKAVVLISGAAIAFYHVIMLRHAVRKGANGLLAIVLTLIAANAATIHFHARPHLGTLLCMAAACYVLDADRRQPSWHVWLLVPMTALWANLHSGFLAWFAVLGLAVAGSYVESLLDPARRAERFGACRRYAWLAAACGIASLATPNGIGLHLHLLRFLQSSWIRANVHEYGSPAFHSEPLYYFMALLFLGLLLEGEQLRQRRVVEVLWLVFFGGLSLVSARHIPVFLVVAVPVICAALSERYGGFLDGITGRVGDALRPVSLWTPAAVVAIAVLLPAARWPSNLSPEMFPIPLVQRHTAELTSSRVFTSDQWGDYLIYAGYPKQRVFIDGRSDFYGEQIGKDYLEIAEGRSRWRENLDRQAVQLVLTPPDCALASLLGNDSGWRLLDRDKQAALFEKRAVTDVSSQRK
jgi:hypothetical protein